MSTDQERFIKIADERNEFVKDVDGYIYWWPSREHGGYLTSYVLRALADELDKRNKDWEKQINDYFANEESSKPLDHQGQAQGDDQRDVEQTPSEHDQLPDPNC